MVEEEKDRLGAAAVSWWREMISRKRERESGCPTCKRLTGDWQSIHPHQADDDFEDDRAKRDAAVNIAIGQLGLSSRCFTITANFVLPESQLSTLHWKSIDEMPPLRFIFPLIIEFRRAYKTQSLLIFMRWSGKK